MLFPLHVRHSTRERLRLGGTNEVSDELSSSPAPTIVISKIRLRLEADQLSDGRILVHNYGHGGAGFTLSWGCAAEVFALADCCGSARTPG
jgi:hypothetical protein